MSPQPLKIYSQGIFQGSSGLQIGDFFMGCSWFLWFYGFHGFQGFHVFKGFEGRYLLTSSSAIKLFFDKKKKFLKE